MWSKGDTECRCFVPDLSSKHAYVSKKPKGIIYMDKDWARVRDVQGNPRTHPKMYTCTEHRDSPVKCTLYDLCSFVIIYLFIPL